MHALLDLLQRAPHCLPLQRCSNCGTYFWKHSGECSAIVVVQYFTDDTL